MKLSFTRSDRIDPRGPERRGGAFVRFLTYGLVVPITLACLLTAGWYIATGETPMDVWSKMASAPRINAPMPPRTGPERPASSLLSPPGQPKPEAAAPAQPPKPAAPPAAETPVVSEPPPPPPLSEPSIPPGGEPLAPPAFSQLPARTDLKPLPPAPSPDLMRNSPNGPLPIMAGDKQARLVYARPFADPKKLPRVAIVVVGLGLSRDATEAAIKKLPPDVSLSFSPYAGNLENWMKQARDAGHEVLMDLPLEPPNFPLHDAGPMAVLAQMSQDQSITHMEDVLAQGQGYVGVAASLRSPVAASPQWVPMLHDLKGRGLLMVGDGLVGVAETDAPASAAVTLVADETPFRAAIDARLGRLMAAAQRDGSALAYASPRPVTFERLLAWIASFPQRGVVLAPVSAVVH